MHALRNPLLIFALVAATCFQFTSCSPDDPPTPTQIVIDAPQTGTKTVTITLETNRVAADGISSVLIRAICKIGGQTATNGLPVTFTTEKGDFSINGVDGISNDGETRNYTVNTVGGIAELYLISDTTPGSTTIRVLFANSATASAVLDFIRTGEEIDSLEMTVTPTSGESPLSTQVSTTVKSKDDNPLQGVLVRYRVTDDNAVIDKEKVKTDSNGEATTFIRNITKDAIIKANASGLQDQQAITITNDQAKALELEVINSSGGISGQDPVLINKPGQLLLKATVDGDSGKVANVEVIFTSTDASTIFNPKSALTDSAGTVEAFANSIMTNSRITATAGAANDRISIRLNNKPIARITKLSGEAISGTVAVFTFSAENSYDPDQAYGDEIETYTWAYTLESSVGAEINSSNTSNDQLITLTCGEFGGVLPADDDVLTVYLTVIDSLGLQRTTQVSYTFAP